MKTSLGFVRGRFAQGHVSRITAVFIYVQRETSERWPDFENPCIVELLDRTTHRLCH